MKRRFRVNYRTLEAMTVRCTYALPWMDDFTHSLETATIFSTNTCNIEYCWIEVPEEDRCGTVLSSPRGLLRLIRMSSGLESAQASSQRAVYTTQSKARWQFILFYLDDVTVYSKSILEYSRCMRTVLALLRNAGVVLKLSACSFLRGTVSYLEHTI